MNILQIIAELQQHAPVKSKVILLRREDAVDEEGVGEDGRAALEAADAQDLAFDATDELPGRDFVIAIRRKRFAAQAAAKALAEAKLFVALDAALVEEVVAVGVKQAVAEDAGREAERRAEQRLQAAGSPRIAAGLHDVGRA